MKKIALLNITGQEVAELCGSGELYQRGVQQLIDESLNKLLYNIDNNILDDLNQQMPNLPDVEHSEN